MPTSIVLWLVTQLVSEAASPAVKLWVVDQLKKEDQVVTNPILKALIEAAEAFLTSKA